LPFLGEEERVVRPVITEWPENLLLQLNQPAEDPAEVVIPQRLFFDAIYVVEEVVGVERVIAKMVVSYAVKPVLARARHKRYLRAGRAPKPRQS